MVAEFKRFPGGIHPAADHGKRLTRGAAIRTPPLLASYVVPLQQHIGLPATAAVAKGAHVLRGQPLAVAGGVVSAAVHAPTSGVVKAITDWPGPTGVRVTAVELQADGEDREDLLPPIAWEQTDSRALVERIRDAGVVGLGGAAFPTHVKLSPPPAKPVDVLVVNAAECEPFLTADERLLVEQPTRVWLGCRIAARVLGVRRIVVGLEEDKGTEVGEFRKLVEASGAEFFALPVRYPQGAERQLIYALTGRRVPAGGLPMDAGCVVHNVATLAAIADAVAGGRALYERTVTVTGTPIVNPGNWRLRIGTPLREALRLAGGVNADPAKLIFGGPLMGVTQHSLDVPVCKGTSGILALAPSEVTQFSSGACIRCGRCLDVCPMRLNPSALSIQAENERFDLAEGSRAMDCIECGCCAFACPAHRPLVQHFRRTKAEIALRRRSAAGKKG